MADDRKRVRLVHWNEQEVPERTARLEGEGYEVDGDVPGTSIGVKQLRENPPAAFVIDLGRLPSHGREVAYALRQSKALRPIPIVFVDGAEDKVEAIRAVLPDAGYTVWDDIGADLRDAIENPPVDPVVPVSDSGPRSGRPLAQKLGVKPDSTLALIDPPEDCEQTLAPLPDGVTLRHGNRGRREMTVWFVTARRELERRFAAVAEAVGEGTLWMAWPKRSSGVESDLTEDAIRDVALPAGMVDTKVCAIDETWSGLRLTRRRGKPS
jgi:CheY-like chemotaxis protein